jgi:hypothetical protein
VFVEADAWHYEGFFSFGQLALQLQSMLSLICYEAVGFVRSFLSFPKYGHSSSKSVVILRFPETLQFQHLC